MVASRMYVPLAGAALLLGLYVYYDIIVYRDYLLHSDEPAFVSASLESPASWFTRGYLNYFDTYPEWGTRHTTPLFKPVTNAVGYLNYVLFGTSYGLHFAVFFLMQFLGLLIFLRVLRELDIRPLPSAAMSLLFLFNPAFINDGLLCLPCHFDVLAGVFALGAFLAVWRERYGVALVLLTLAVLTKESAIFAPVAASLSVLIWRRRLIMSAVLLLPLPLWAAARFLAFGDVLEAGLSTPTGQIGFGLSIWPTGLVSYGFVNQLGLSLPSSRYEILSAIFLIANIGLWVFLCYATVVTARRHIDAAENTKLAMGLLLWTLGALSFGVLAGFGARYGGSIYPFLYLFLAAFFFTPAFRISRWVVASVLLVFFAANALQSERWVRMALLWPSVIAPERALYDALKALPQDGRTVYIVNAPRGLAAQPHHLKRAWGLNLDMVVINQFSGCAASPDAGQLLDSGSDVISVRIPGCAVFDFAYAKVQPLSDGTGITLSRDGIGTYAFPGGVAASATDSLDFGRTLTLYIQSKSEGLTLIGYDWTRESYEVITDLGFREHR
jgi:hypothetical protein